MPETYEFVIQRANATRGAQASIATAWSWEEKTLAQWDADIAACIAQKETAADAEAGKDQAAAQLDVVLDPLHNKTRDGLALAKVKFRNDPVQNHLFKTLKAGGDSRPDILEEALEFESAWEKADATWEPIAGLTLAAFKTSRLAGIAATENYAGKIAAGRHESAALNRLKDQLYGDCIAWYEVATTLFPAGTTEGDMVRGTIPVASSTELPGQAVFENYLADTPGQVNLTVVSPHATACTILGQGPGATTFTVLLDHSEQLEVTLTGLAAGAWLLKAIPHNSRGDGPASDTLSIAVI